MTSAVPQKGLTMPDNVQAEAGLQMRLPGPILAMDVLAGGLCARDHTSRHVQHWLLRNFRGKHPLQSSQAWLELQLVVAAC